VWVVQSALDANGVQQLFTSNTIPEPNAFALLGLGTLAFGLIRCRE
jgi:hypothetical protein